MATKYQYPDYQPTSRTFGVEIELIAPFDVTPSRLATLISAAGVPCFSESYNHSTRSWWKIVSDASVSGGAAGRGMELVSPPLTLAEGREQVEAVCRVLAEAGCSVNRSCGLHVHWAAGDLGLSGLKNLARLWVKYEGLTSELLPASRRGNNNLYCRDNVSLLGYGQATDEAAAKGAMVCVKVARNLRSLIAAVSPTRYGKLNLQSIFVHGTTEFRAASGTIDATKIMTWALLTGGFVECAKVSKFISMKGGANWSTLLTLVSDKGARKFLTERRAALAARDALAGVE